MPGAYSGRIRYIQDGEPVAAGVANRPSQDLAGNDAYLKDRLDSAALGEGVSAFGSSLSASVLANTPVAWNAATSRFEPALAQAIVDPITGAYVPGPLSDCLGVCASKDNATFGTVVLGGRFATDLAGVVADASTLPGRYYLSSSAAGMLTRVRPPVAVPVLYWDGTHAYVGPNLHSFLESHAHYRFALACRPAGTAHDDGAHQSILAPDATLPGWLPADHAAFAGKAPTGAVFGYNVAADAALAATWPPQPLASLVLVLDKGAGHLGGTIVPQGLDGLAYADRTTIWWMSACSGDAPWPMAYPVPPAGPNSSLGGECPRAEDMRLTASFTEMLAETDKAVVTSLVAAAGSPLAFTDCAGNPASAGPLVASIDLGLLTDPALVDGAVVLKRLDAGAFKQGKVVEGLLAGANVTLASADTETAGAATLYQGRVTIAVDVDPAGRELAPQVIRLADAAERPYQGILYIGFPPGRQAAIRLRLNVPYAGLPAVPMVKVRLLLLATAAGTLPATTMDRMAIPQPAGPTALPTATIAVACDTNVACGANQVVQVDSDPFPVAAGDTLIVNFTRAAGDGYSGELGVVRAAGILVDG